MAALTLLALTAFLQAQATPTLADYLKLHPEDGGLALGAENLKADQSGSGLACYGRKLAHVGGVSVVSPLTMIWFEDNLTKAPNLYDGLPRQAKILYLLSLLNGAQWRKATGPGLGLDDLKGEPRAVLLSILPKNPKWYSVRVKPDYSRSEPANWSSLDEEAAQGMRFKLENSLDFVVNLDGNPRSSTSVSPSFERGKPGEVLLFRYDTEDEESRQTYGVAMRQEVPNVPKKGQLDTNGLNAKVTVPAQTTVADLLTKIGAATGRELYADLRVRNLSVSYPSGSARAGDLLDAIALAVCGTYRKVDRAYLLVADVVGVGTRRVRQTAWKEEIDLEVAERKLAWQRGIRANGLALTTEFPDDPLTGVTGSVKSHVEASIKKPYPLDSFPASELSAEQRAYLDRENARSKGRLSTDKLSVTSELRYRFLLPGGEPFQIEGSVGMMSTFVPSTPGPPMGPDYGIPMAVNRAGAVRPLVLRPTSTAEAGLAVKLARAFGFTELWLETDKADLLTEATKSGLPVRLFVRPWALATSRGDSDKTILGETGRATAARQATSPLWINMAVQDRLQIFPRLPRRLAQDDLISPWDPAWPARRNAISTLARTTGLAGVVLSGTEPHGYEPKENGGNLYSRTLVEAWAFGYDERARLDFFKQVGYDPVDTTTEDLRTDVDMDTPTFPRYPARPLPLIREAYETWISYRAKANLAAITDLRNALGNLPVLVDVRKVDQLQALRESETLAPWALGQSPPEYEDQFVPPMDGAIPLISAPPAKRIEMMTDFGNAAKYFARRPTPQAFDLTQLPAAQWAEYLGKWLNPIPATPKPSNPLLHR